MNWTAIANSATRLAYNQTGILVSATWNGLTIRGVRTTLKRQDVNTDSGLAEEYDFSLLCPASQFNGVFPQARRDKIFLDGKPRRVLSLELDSPQAFVKLNLGSVTQ